MGKLKVSDKDIDPTLADLFSSSAGPVKAPPVSRYSALQSARERIPIGNKNIPGEDEDDEILSELEDEELDDEAGGNDILDQLEEGGAEAVLDDARKASKKDRKRKRKDEYDDLESKYLRKLADNEDDDEPSEKRVNGDVGEGDAKNAEAEAAEDTDEDSAPLIHETLMKKGEGDVDIEIDKANRTLFLGNVSIEAVSSSKAKKELLAHLASPLADLDAASGPHKVESLRFRSTPFSTGGLPKRAAYITKSVMSATSHSTNAYAVYSSPVAARAALRALNGTVVLDRHLRADSVAHPADVAHRRCVFVGNLGFVDDETVLSTTAEGETVSKKRTKVPADVEEGLWRIFGQHAGPVDSVRVPRDPKTRVGKGFAYVQFRDGNDVESALLLDGKKFPPMLPRALRVSRAKDPRKTVLASERSAKARLADAAATADRSGDGAAAGKPKSTKYKHKITPEQQSLAGRAGRLFGKAGAARKTRELKRGDGKAGPPKMKPPRGGAALAGLDIKTPEQVVFEGRRTSSKDGKPRDLKFNKGQKGKKSRVPSKLKGRGAKRAAEWRKKAPST